jgi:hypothetical protein
MPFGDHTSRLEQKSPKLELMVEKEQEKMIEHPKTVTCYLRNHNI